MSLQSADPDPDVLVFGNSQ